MACDEKCVLSFGSANKDEALLTLGVEQKTPTSMRIGEGQIVIESIDRRPNPDYGALKSQAGALSIRAFVLTNYRGVFLPVAIVGAMAFAARVGPLLAIHVHEYLLRHGGDVVGFGPVARGITHPHRRDGDANLAAALSFRRLSAAWCVRRYVFHRCLAATRLRTAIGDAAEHLIASAP